jgi:hypothetical protein
MVNNSKSVRSDATLKSTPNTLKTVKVTQLGCNFLSEEIIKKVIRTETPGSDRGRGEMDRFTNTLEHAVTADLLRPQHAAGYVVRTSRVAA